MRIDLSALARQAGRAESYALEEWLGPEDGVEWKGPVRGDLGIRNTGTNVLALRARVQTCVCLECARCLEPFRIPISHQFEEKLAIGAGGQLRVADEETWEGAGDLLIEDKWLDVNELVRQQLLLALPTRPLCRPQCRGLCPKCGTNLNQGDCGCRREAPERPLGRLGEVWAGRHAAGHKRASKRKVK